MRGQVNGALVVLSLSLIWLATSTVASGSLDSNLPLLCSELGESVDGQYVTLYYARDGNKPFRAFCKRVKKQGRDAVEYVINTYIDVSDKVPSNTFEYLKGQLMEGSDKMVTTYMRVKLTTTAQKIKAGTDQQAPGSFAKVENIELDDGVLAIDGMDDKYSVTNGGFEGTMYTFNHYGTAGGCDTSQNGKGMIDLRGTNFTLSRDTRFKVEGHLTRGRSARFSDHRKVAHISGGGLCGKSLPDGGLKLQYMTDASLEALKKKEKKKRGKKGEEKKGKKKRRNEL